jgi:hypothetical protein
MMKINKLLLTLAFCFALNAFNGCNKRNAYGDYDQQEVIVVNKIPGGAYSEEDSLAKSKGIGWYDIGLSRNGEEPVEYIWSTGKDPYSYAILKAEIGDRGIINLNEWAKKDKRKLPRPNAEKPPIIGLFGEVYWEKKDKNPQ